MVNGQHIVNFSMTDRVSAVTRRWNMLVQRNNEDWHASSQSTYLMIRLVNRTGTRVT